MYKCIYIMIYFTSYSDSGESRAWPSLDNSKLLMKGIQLNDDRNG